MNVVPINDAVYDAPPDAASELLDRIGAAAPTLFKVECAWCCGTSRDCFGKPCIPCAGKGYIVEEMVT